MIVTYDTFIMAQICGPPWGPPSLRTTDVKHIGTVTNSPHGLQTKKMHGWIKCGHFYVVGGLVHISAKHGLKQSTNFCS